MNGSRDLRHTTFRIGEVAALAGVSVEALRFYEREGLLPPVPRSTSGIRRFGPDTLGRVRFIKQAQSVGLTLKDIRTLVRFRQGPSRAACREIRRILADRIAAIDGRLRELQAFQDLLQQHLEACDRALARRSETACPALDAFERTSGS
jgi:DNA-binding transcriptional MerR regulator